MSRNFIVIAAIERANTLLTESILFRSTVISEIHNEIYQQIWEKWDHYNTQRIIHEHKDKKPTTCGPVSGMVSHSRGSHRYYKSLD